MAATPVFHEDCFPVTGNKFFRKNEPQGSGYTGRSSSPRTKAEVEGFYQQSIGMKYMWQWNARNQLQQML